MDGRDMGTRFCEMDKIGLCYLPNLKKMQVHSLHFYDKIRPTIGILNNLNTF